METLAASCVADDYHVGYLGKFHRIGDPEMSSRLVDAIKWYTSNERLLVTQEPIPKRHAAALIKGNLLTGEVDEDGVGIMTELGEFVLSRGYRKG